MTNEPGWLAADWPAPPNIHAGTTTRSGGVSAGAWASLNLGDHVGDDHAAVVENRRRLVSGLVLPSEPVWLNQIHGTTVVSAVSCGVAPEADASVAQESDVVCAVLTADCLPVLFCNRSGTEVAVAHAGWRGLVGGVLAETIATMQTPVTELLAWLGPGIGSSVFEVGPEVRQAFLDRDPVQTGAFTARGDKYLTDIYAAARRELATLGVWSVYGGEHCTVSEPERFFSYRRDGTCGRMASLIWMD